MRVRIDQRQQLDAAGFIEHGRAAAVSGDLLDLDAGFAQAVGQQFTAGFGTHDQRLSACQCRQVEHLQQGFGIGTFRVGRAGDAGIGVGDAMPGQRLLAAVADNSGNHAGGPCIDMGKRGIDRIRADEGHQRIVAQMTQRRLERRLAGRSRWQRGDIQQRKNAGIEAQRSEACRQRLGLGARAGNDDGWAAIRLGH